MIQLPITKAVSSKAQRDSAMIDFLKAMVIVKPFDVERLHVLFVDRDRAYLGDAPMGSRRSCSVSLRMRDLFAMALSHGAHGIIVAHNHPSGLCRPSRADIESTQRMGTVAKALDIDLLDHLIFTKDAVYSMRAGAIHEFKSRKPVLSR
ncbi:JAB domain-containing protein [uncultured Erythrobacter sp.]|uniref:JAB domain-containing protein n=1 Tax=uncultured Erythrobacter sp. TaxID=263913 RepID=UPI00262205A7|nr:JAB domain-containing protein [uncultured Erythrobacter sp.]